MVKKEINDRSVIKYHYCTFEKEEKRCCELTTIQIEFNGEEDCNQNKI